jgi:hypothetical protein
MARVRIEKLNPPEEVELGAAQAGKVIGAGPVVYAPYGPYGVVTVNPYVGTLGPLSGGVVVGPWTPGALGPLSAFNYGYAPAFGAWSGYGYSPLGGFAAAPVYSGFIYR